MENTEENLSQITKPKNPMLDLGVLLVFVMVGMFLAQFLGLIAVLPYFDYKIEAFKEAVSGEVLRADAKVPMLIIQAFSSLCAFIMAPLLFYTIYDKQKTSDFAVKPPMSFTLLLTILVLVIMAMPFNSMVIEWNQSWVFPDFMATFENWAKGKEKQLELMTRSLTDLHGAGEFAFGFLVFAILPAIGEELLFRGIVQKKFMEASGNIHVAIWFTGFMFSAIHMQFYGLIPRMLLGVMFGYLYYWSNNLIVPIFAHFVYNGFTIVMLFLRNEGLIDIDIESTDGVPLQAALSSGVVVTGLIYGLYWYFKVKKGGVLPGYLKAIFG